MPRRYLEAFWEDKTHMQPPQHEIASVPEPREAWGPHEPERGQPESGWAQIEGRALEIKCLGV